jgi:ATP-dependent helicase/nuclease subunit A
MAGIVDQLIVGPDRVLAIDYKTNAVVPASVDTVPDGLHRQMAAYAHALRLIYPDRVVEVALLWTRTATLMHLPPALLDTALEAALLDAEGPRP